MKSLHDYRGEHKAAKRRYLRAYNAWFQSPRNLTLHGRLNLASFRLTAAYTRRFNAEVAYREGAAGPMPG